MKWLRRKTQIVAVPESTTRAREDFRSLLARLDEIAFELPDEQGLTMAAEMIEAQRSLGFLAPPYAIGCAMERLRTLGQGTEGFPEPLVKAVVALLFATLWSRGRDGVSSAREVPHEEVPGPARQGPKGLGDAERIEREGLDARADTTHD